MRIFARRCLGANASSNLKKTFWFCVKYQLFEACSWDDDWNTRAEILNREHRGGRYSEYCHAMRFGNGGEGEDVKLVRRRVLLEYSRLGVLVEL